MIQVDTHKNSFNNSSQKKYKKQHSPYRRAYIPVHQPWMNMKIELKENSDLEYHNELLRFSEWATLTIEERSIRNDVVQRLKKIILSIHPEANVKVYGSFESNLSITQSDIDLVVCNTNIKDGYRYSEMVALACEFHKQKVSSEFPTVISHTKVPIIKLMDSKTKCMIDINFEFDAGLKNTIAMKRYLSEYSFLRPLTIIVKYYLKFCLLNDPYTGGIGSYALLILILSYLQNHTSCNVELKDATKDENLETILIGFFQYYGHEFDYSNHVISVLNNGKYLQKIDKKWYNEDFPDALAIEDPENTENDLGKSSFSIHEVITSFQHAYLYLSNPNIKSPNNSIVSRLIFIPTDLISYRCEIKRLWEQLNNSSYHQSLNNISNNLVLEKETKPYEKDIGQKSPISIENNANTNKSNKKRFYHQIDKKRNQKTSTQKKHSKGNLKYHHLEETHYLSDQHFPQLQSQ